MLVNHKIVFKQTGENATTDRDPYVPLDSFTGDLQAQKTCCMSFDNDMLVAVDEFEVREVPLPEWLSPSEWIRNSVSWGYLWARGVSPMWPEHYQRRLMQLSGIQQLVLAKLLRTKNFRSDFRRSLCEQAIKWLEGESQYSGPLSGRQWDALITVHDTRELRQVDNNCYRNRLTVCGAVA